LIKPEYLIDSLFIAKNDQEKIFSDIKEEELILCLPSFSMVK